MNFETERAVVLMAKKILAPAEYSAADELELKALTETLRTRWEDRPRYTFDVRGIDALERLAARAEKRDPDYGAARAAAALTPGT